MGKGMEEGCLSYLGSLGLLTEHRESLDGSRRLDLSWWVLDLTF